MTDCIASTGSCGGCFGDSVVACPEEGAPLGFKIDCSAVSLQCVETTEGFSASCGAGTCNTQGNSCEGSQRSACELGVAKEYDCETADLKCESDGSEDAWCQGQSGPCSADADAAICVGTLARNCVGGGWQEQECAFLGDAGSHQCSVTQEETPRALCIFDAGCDPGSFVPTCEDGNLELCPSGRPIAIDCGGLGLGGCTLTPSAGCQGFGDR